MRDMEAIGKTIYPKYSDFKENYPVYQPLADVHLYGTFENGVAVGRRITLVRNLGLIGLLILVVSFINFVSLVTARASVRSKEIGIRKVLEASVVEIIGLLSKSYLVLIFLGWLLALPLSWMILRSWLDNFTYQIDLSWQYFALAGLLTLIISILAVSVQASKAAIMNPVKPLRSV